MNLCYIAEELKALKGNAEPGSKREAVARLQEYVLESPGSGQAFDEAELAQVVEMLGAADCEFLSAQFFGKLVLKKQHRHCSEDMQL